MQKLPNTTLIFLVKRQNGTVNEICLAMKKRSFGAGRWNGVGGKLLEGETIESAAIREAQEEIGVTIKNLQKVAELEFHFPHNPSWDQLTHTFFVEEWEGEPAESEEMKPEWFTVDKIPFESMWPDDIFWLPEVIKGQNLQAMFTFGEGDMIVDQNIQTVASL